MLKGGGRLTPILAYAFDDISRTSKKRRIIRTVYLAYLLQLCEIGIFFYQIFCLLCIKVVSDVGPYQTIC